MPLPLKGAVKALIPKIELPRYFRITSTPGSNETTIVCTVNVQGAPKEFKGKAGSAPVLLDIVQAFPKLDMEKIPPLIRTGLGMVPLPTDWVLECQPAKKKEGFLLTLDIKQRSGATKHYEKELEVTTVMLAEFLDVLEWVKEANKIDRFNPEGR
jgi:hypothetical protein